MSKPKADVTWETPPPRQTERYDWTAIAEQLRSKPGAWAKIFENDRASLATAIRTSGIRALLPSEGFEVRTTNNVRGEPRTCDMYLRYNPKKAGKK